MIQVRRNFERGSLPRCTETIEADSSGRLANRPPDAALDPLDVEFLGIEDRLRAVMDQRDSLLKQVKKLETERDHLVARITEAWMLLDRDNDRPGVREVVLIGALKASRRTIKQLIVGCGSVIVILLAALLAMWGNG